MERDVEKCFVSAVFDDSLVVPETHSSILDTHFPYVLWSKAEFSTLASFVAQLQCYYTDPHLEPGAPSIQYWLVALLSWNLFGASQANNTSTGGIDFIIDRRLFHKDKVHHICIPGTGSGDSNGRLHGNVLLVGGLAPNSPIPLSRWTNKYVLVRICPRPSAAGDWLFLCTTLTFSCPATQGMRPHV